MLAVVAPAASASAFRRPSLLNDASHNVGLTLEGLKPRSRARASLGKLDEVIRRSVEGGWLRLLGDKEGLEDLMHVKSWDSLKQWVAKNWDVVVEAAVRRLGGDVRSELEALRNKLNDDKVAREVVAPALLLIQEERLGVNEETLRYFGAVISGAIGGDGYVSAAEGKVMLASGERGVALLWGATLAAYGIETEERRVGSVFHVVAFGDDAARLAGLYFRYGAPLLEGDDRLKNYKLAEAVELGAKEALNIRWEGLRRRTEDGPVAADLTISVGGAAVKYNVYLLKNAIELEFQSTDRSRVELAARLLKLAGVGAEVKKREGKREVWYVYAYTDVLAAGREELRKALAEIVREALTRGWIDAGKAERWLEKLEEGRVLKEGWAKYGVWLARSGTLEVKYHSTNSGNIEQEAQWLKEMGLEEGKHFSVKMPEGGGAGYVNILKEGLAHAAWLSVHGSGRQQELAVAFVEHILQRAREAGEDVRKKAEEIVEEGKVRRYLTLKGFEKRVEVGGREHVVKVIDGGAIKEKQNGKTLLRIWITAEVDGVTREYKITYSRSGADNAAVGRTVARADDPDGREKDAERFSALIRPLRARSRGCTA
jgi:predicted nucleic acid-binding OB-fold protein